MDDLLCDVFDFFVKFLSKQFDIDKVLSDGKVDLRLLVLDFVVNFFVIEQVEDNDIDSSYDELKFLFLEFFFEVEIL